MRVVSRMRSASGALAPAGVVATTLIATLGSPVRAQATTPVPAQTSGQVAVQIQPQDAPRVPALPPALTDTGAYLYTLVPDESEDIRVAIEHTIAHMNFIIRPIARRRLTRANRASDRLTFVVGRDTLGVAFSGLNPIVMLRTGTPVPWTRGSTRERYAVNFAVAGDTLRQWIVTDDGQRENDFVFLDGGATVAMHVTLSAERLPTPLRYMLTFHRQSAPSAVGHDLAGSPCPTCTSPPAPANADRSDRGPPP